MDHDYLDYQQELSQTIRDNGAIQTAFSEKNLIEVIGDFGEKFNLNLEQIGVIYNLVNQILTGEMSAEGFTEKLKKEAKEGDWSDFDDKKIDGIVSDLNEKIFIPVRQVIMKADKTDTEDEDLDKDEILSGIENPTKSAYRSDPINPYAPKTQSTISANTGNSNTTQPVTPKPVAPSAPAAKVTALEIEPEMNLIEAKLAGAVKAPVIKVDVTPKPAVESAPKPPKKYDVDPYRELPN